MMDRNIFEIYFENPEMPFGEFCEIFKGILGIEKISRIHLLILFEELNDYIAENPSSLDYLKVIEYEKYLNTKAWKAKSKIVREFYENKCMVCGTSNEEIHCHHNDYSRMPFEKFNDLYPLCQACHSNYHRMKKLYPYLNKYIINGGK